MENSFAMKPRLFLCLALVLSIFICSPVARGGDTNIVHNGNAQHSSPDNALKQDERAKAYFRDYLTKCGTNEIRCLWFLQDNPGIGMVMTINLNEESVTTAREVYDWATQSFETRKLSHSQILNLEKIISSLPASDKNADFNKSVFVSIWNEKGVEEFQYDRQHVPGIVQRIYDIGGGYLN